VRASDAVLHVWMLERGGPRWAALARRWMRSQLLEPGSLNGGIGCLGIEWRWWREGGD
jgi:hypothetical protein